MNRIPTVFLVQSNLFHDIIETTSKIPNDLDLGAYVRNLINDYNEGKFNPPSDIEFDTPIVHPH